MCFSQEGEICMMQSFTVSASSLKTSSRDKNPWTGKNNWSWLRRFTAAKVGAAMFHLAKRIQVPCLVIDARKKHQNCNGTAVRIIKMKSLWGILSSLSCCYKSNWVWILKSASDNLSRASGELGSTKGRFRSLNQSGVFIVVVLLFADWVVMWSQMLLIRCWLRFSSCLGCNYVLLVFCVQISCGLFPLWDNWRRRAVMAALLMPYCGLEHIRITSRCPENITELCPVRPLAKNGSRLESSSLMLCIRSLMASQNPCPCVCEHTKE